ncbi:DUF1570 domain-containing protein [bacterium]|nr:DUF1570 domain-containing protein [bacterium]
MDPPRSNFRTHDDARVAHLIEAFGGSGRVERAGRTTFVVANEVDSAAVRSAMVAVGRTIREIESWAAVSQAQVRNPGPSLTIGLFADLDAYDRYLVSESLRGLSGSLGMTHPVRSVCCAVVGESPHGVDARTIIAHESVHLWTLRSGLCPAWQAWPRWLHEGFAQLWDHLATAAGDPATATSQAPGSSGFRIEPNRDRQRDWRRIANSTDVERFLRTDMIRDHRRHGDDYATCWAITFALATWGEGALLPELVNHLVVQDLQPFSGVPAEKETLGWLKTRVGGKWAEFADCVASAGRT